MTLSAAVERAGMTTLGLVSRSGGVGVTLRRDWDPTTPFADYGRAFQLDQVPCSEPAALGDREARKRLADLGAGGALSELEGWMRAGRHESVMLFVHAELGIRLCHYIHSSRLGRRNGHHALRAGGIRRHPTDAPEAAVLRDGLNLSRAMSFKCAAAQMPFGGSKTTLIADVIDPDDASRVGFLAHCIDSGHLMTGPDVGFAPELIDALAARYTPHILCGPSGPVGHTGGPTAEGVLAALRSAAELRWGSPKLGGRRVAIQGLGSVGLSLGSRLGAEGAQIIAADPDPERVALARAQIPKVEIVSPADVLYVDCDVLSPCALGGVLSRDSLSEIRCQMIYGGANNQLDAFTTEEELELADLLAARGILFQPDWTYTMGGILNGWEEYRQRESASAAKVHADILERAGAGTLALLREAEASGRTPTAVAVERYFPLVHGAGLADPAVR